MLPCGKKSICDKISFRFFLNRKTFEKIEYFKTWASDGTLDS